MSLDTDDEILQDFLIEAGEILERLNEELVELEQSPDDNDLLNAVFRGFPSPILHSGGRSAAARCRRAAHPGGAARGLGVFLRPRPPAEERGGSASASGPALQRVSLSRATYRSRFLYGERVRRSNKTT